MESPTCEEYVNSDAEAFWSAFVLPRIVLIEGTASRNRAGSKVRAQKMLDNELSAMRLAMCSIRTRRNALCSISALPAEVLVRVFEFYAAIQPPASMLLRRLGWINVTHVCRLWRDTALQYPGLWNNICFRLGVRWAKAMLSRAKAVPLVLSEDVSWVSQRSMKLISQHVPRARKLSLYGGMADLKSIVDTSLPPSEALKTIRLGPLHGNVLERRGTNFELPEAIAGRRLPSLGRIMLGAFWVPWSAPILWGLTHLEMRLHRSRNPANDGYLNSSHEKVFCALKNMPGLETLILAHCLPSGPWKDGGSDVLQLPRLGVLHLKGPSAACFGIVKRLYIPPSCQVQLHGTDDSADITEILPFLMVYASETDDLPPWYTLSINTDRVPFFNLEMWRRCGPVEDPVEFLPGMDADLEISFHNNPSSLRPLKSLCRGLPFGNVVTLFVQYAALDLSIQDWIDVFGECKDLEVVSFKGESPPTSFWMALSMTTDCKAVARLQTCEQEHLFLGKLSVLELSDVDFRCEDSSDADVPHSLLKGSLTERQRVKAVPMLDVSLVRCSIKKEWVEDLSKVAVLDWDRQEGECEFDTEQEQGDLDEDEDGDER